MLPLQVMVERSGQPTLRYYDIPLKDYGKTTNLSWDSQCRSKDSKFNVGAFYY